MNFRELTFYFPYHEVSGVPVLFTNLAKYIAEYYDIKVNIVDYEDGYMAKQLQNIEQIRHIVFRTGKKLYIKTDVLIMQSILPYSMRPELNIDKSTRLLLWNLHPDNFFPWVFPFQILRSIPKKNLEIYKIFLYLTFLKKTNLIKTFIINARNKKGLYFMDSSNMDLTGKVYDIKFKKKDYFPIACSFGEIIQKQITPSKLNISWIGRLCDFKIYILLYFIKKLSVWSKEKGVLITFHIIGDGPEKRRITPSLYENKYFKIIFVGRIEKKEMDNYLMQNIDINASMGTSALESAKYGIPTILLDMIEYPVKGGYKFRWLFETEGYDLAHKITEKDIENNNTSLNKLLLQALNQYKEIQEKTYLYYKENHSLDSVSKQLIINANNTTLTFGDIDQNLLKKGLLRRIYEKKKYGI